MKEAWLDPNPKNPILSHRILSAGHAAFEGSLGVGVAGRLMRRRVIVLRAEGDAKLFSFFGSVARAFVGEPLVGGAGSFAVAQVMLVVGEIGFSCTNNVGGGVGFEKVRIDYFCVAVVEVNDVAVSLW